MEKNYKFSPSHEWVKVENGHAYVGISSYAAKKLAEVVYVDLPNVGDHFAQFAEFGAIESVKAASELYAPVSGTVLEINESLQDEPEKINQNAAEAWMIKLSIDQPSELDALLTYDAYIETTK